MASIKVNPSEWDEEHARVKASQPGGALSAEALNVREGIRRDVARLNRIDRRLEASGMAYSVDDQVDEFCRYGRDYSLFNFISASSPGCGRTAA